MVKQDQQNLQRKMLPLQKKRNKKVFGNLELGFRFNQSVLIQVFNNLGIRALMISRNSNSQFPITNYILRSQPFNTPAAFVQTVLNAIV